MSSHEEWLSLIEVSGPFLTVPVLERVFPQGLDVLDREVATRLRSARKEWAEAQEQGGNEAKAIHLAWIEMILHEALGFDEEVLLADGQISDSMHVEVAEHHERLSPDYVVANPPGGRDEGKSRLLVRVWPPSQDLGATVEGRSWSASPAERMTTLCRASGIRLGLVTNGERWMLVDAPVGETSGYASWYASLWSQEPLTLRAFQSLLSARRFFGVAEKDTLEAMLTDSVAYQQEVTDQLGTQVRQAVEVLVQALDRADQDRGRNLLQDVPPERLYNAALTVMMRLVFLFCSEERGLLLLGDPIYDAYYAVSALRGQLREEANRIGIEVLERRQDAWARLLATFRGVYSGIQHETLRLPALDGSLFDPDRYPFLEGRKDGTNWRDTIATPLPIDNRTVLHLLESLQLLRRKGGRGSFEARRLSFRALDIEQIGHVYEGLLDHVAVRVESPTVGLKGAQGYEPEIALGDLEQKQAEGEQELLDFLREKTKRSESALRNGLSRILEDETRERLRVACGSDKELVVRVLPYHALLRDDVWCYPVVYRADSFIVTGGRERRETGTHYTPRSLTETIVAGTLTPLVYEGPAEGKPREAWKLRSPKHLLDLKICDMAMGSGAFLVQVCRWLGERLVESWEEAEAQGKVILGEGTFADGAGGGHDLLPKDRDERLLIARRLLAERCIYGVDVNPMAVELAKLSIWLVTMAKGRPCGFLDHNLRCGDSLLGVRHVDQIRHFHMNPERGSELHHSLFDPTKHIDDALQQALAQRREIRGVRILDIEDILEMARLHRESHKALEKVEIIADLLVGCYVASAGQSQAALEKHLVAQLYRLQQWLTGRDELRAELEHEAQRLLAIDCPERLKPRRTFHWPLEFPEVFIRENPGFDAIVGNPPFMKGHYISRNFGDAYRESIVETLAGTNAGLADLVAFFFARAAQLLRQSGLYGLIATNTIADGDTNKVGLDLPIQRSLTVICANLDIKWPGTAGVYVSTVNAHKGSWHGIYVLDSERVDGISAQLSSGVSRTPKRLVSHGNVSFIGSYLLGKGFEVPEEVAMAWISEKPEYANVVRPYINGKELYTYFDLTPRRRAICFWDWPKEEAAKFERALEQVQSLVKPMRDKVKRIRNRRLWWLHAENRPGLYHAIGQGVLFHKHPHGWRPSDAMLDRVLAKAKTSNTWAFAFLQPDILYDQSLTVFAAASFSMFAQLQSTLHEVWAWQFGSTLKTDLSYTPSSVFETYPWLPETQALGEVGCAYYRCREQLMMASKQGLTSIYNRFHDPEERTREMDRLRSLHMELDKAVAHQYGWDDLDLCHTFRKTRHGVCFTLSEAAEREVLDRLLQLNQNQHDVEVGEGLHS